MSSRTCYGIHCLTHSKLRLTYLANNPRPKTIDCRLRGNDESVPKLAVDGSNLFGLIVILLLARRIKALLQKRSFLKVVRMMTQEQKQYLTNSGLMIEKRY